MSLGELFVEVVIISASGVFAPGPLTVATIVSGSKYGEKAGFKITLGHSIVEFPLVILIAVGVIKLLENQTILMGIGVVGLAVLVILGSLMIRDAVNRTNSLEGSIDYANPLLIGFIFSATNAHFIIWWFLVGSLFIKDAVEFMGILGVGIAYIFHIWLDLVWFVFLTYMSSRGKNILDTRGYRIFLAAMGVFIIVFGIELALSIFSKCS